MTSLFDRKTKTQRLWNADPAVWGKHSPLLFPIVGRLKQDLYRLNGTAYPLPKHGFAQRSLFSVSQPHEGNARFTLKDSPETRQSFPFPFLLTVEYTLSGNLLTLRYRVDNPGGSTMYFSIGAHPAFACALGDRLRFACPETAGSYTLGADGLRQRDTREIFHGGNLITLTPELFSQDALIFEGLHSPFVTLESPAHSRTVRVDFGGAPCLGLWAKPGAPYVCIEPWFGLDDDGEGSPDITQKAHIQALPAGKSFRYTVTVTIE